MTERMHPEDMVALVAGMFAQRLSITESIEGAHTLLAELARTAPKPEPETPSDDWTPEAGSEAHWREIAEKAEAKVNGAMAFFRAFEIAHVDELEGELSDQELMAGLGAKCAKRIKEWVSRAKDAEAEVETMKKALDAADRVALQNRLAQIDAAKAEEPPMPNWDTAHWSSSMLRDLQAWGRQGWDLAAALRVELAKETRGSTEWAWLPASELRDLRAKIARYESAEGEIPEVPNGPYSRSWPEMHKFMTDLRARLVKATAELAEAKHLAGNAVWPDQIDEAVAQAREEGREEEREWIIGILAVDLPQPEGYPNLLVVPEDPAQDGLTAEELRAALAPKPEVKP